MYTFFIQDSKGGFMEYDGIVKVIYTTAVERITLEGEDIFTHLYSTNYDLHLFSATDAYTVSKNSIDTIQVTKEN